MEDSTARILHHVEQPYSWSTVPRALVVRGWCFSTGTQNRIEIRVRAGTKYFTGIVDIPRPDVKLVHRSAPENSGFEIRTFLPTGLSEVILQARSDPGQWITLTSAVVRINRRWLPLWLGSDNDQWADLIAYQTPTHAKYSPQTLRAGKFPAFAFTDQPKPKISIVTPSFQQARYLPDTLRSVTQQTCADCEYIVQDGVSTDGSVEIIRNAASRSLVSVTDNTRTPKARVFEWESVKDGGQSDAILRGFTKTSGKPADLMAWINSDDFYMPGALAFVAEYFSRHPEVDVIYGHRVLVDEESREIGRWFLPKHDNEILKLNDFVPQETLFWRRRIWDKVGGLDKSFQFAMDWDLLLRFQAAGARIVRVPYFLACFRIHAAQKTSSAMRTVGQSEITRLRERTFGCPFAPEELEKNPLLLRYLRKSAWIEFLWKLGIRAS